MKKSATLKKFLNELEKEDLIEEIEKIHAKFDVVRKYFQVEISGDTLPFLEKAKKAIHSKFWTGDGRMKRPKIAPLNKIVKDFEQISIYNDDLIDLYLYRVEASLKLFTRTSSVTDAFIKSMLTVYDRAVKMIEEENVQYKFVSRTTEIDLLLIRHAIRPNYE